jgi:FlaA1/EpsC-like NDP-sugar epimerase
VKKDDKKNILIVGAGEAGRMVAGEIESHKELNARVICFLDDDPELAGTRIADVPVLGRVEELEAVTASYPVDEIIIAIPTAPGRFIRETVKRCKLSGLPCKIVPGIMEIIRGAVHIEQVREVRVEDLLGRETVSFDIESAQQGLSGRRILVTGAGGSIGSELCRQIAPFEPAELVLLGRGENRIFEIENELRAMNPPFSVDTVISDLRDSNKVKRLIGDLSPQIIYHTAAHKHVHYMERDPEEAVINNVAASVNVIEAAIASGAERFVFISTDKAADPVGVMGATKRLVELYMRSRSGNGSCRLITVRFGNVIGSTGSVVPLFLKQIARGGPVTVSDPGATRFFMTVREAALLVIRASIIGEGGEIFILDMGEPLNILEIARDIIVLTGHEPDTEIPIRITGLRSGEKLHEELFGADEERLSLGEEQILLARPLTPHPEGVVEMTEKIIESAVRGDRTQVCQIMSRLIPGLNLRDGSDSRRAENR